jgi:hypothetical protein
MNSNTALTLDAPLHWLVMLFGLQCPLLFPHWFLICMRKWTGRPF